MMSAAPTAADVLLHGMLSGDPAVRLRAFTMLCRRGYGGALVADLACSDRDDHTLTMTVAQLWAHLRHTDSQGRIRSRGGHLLHTPGTVEWFDEDLHGTAYGPGIGRAG